MKIRMDGMEIECNTEELKQLLEEDVISFKDKVATPETDTPIDTQTWEVAKPVVKRGRPSKSVVLKTKIEDRRSKRMAWVASKAKKISVKNPRLSWNKCLKMAHSMYRG